MTRWDDDAVVQRLREYLMIDSVHPDIDYDPCVAFIKNQALEIGLPVQVHEFVAKKPVVVVTWEGTDPALPSILLNSHMDVVPVYEEHWKHPPFAAHVTEDGLIYARGTQDMKSIGMAHLEVIRNLKNSGIRLKRTVHISFVPDEEIGGEDGMKQFSESEEFKKLNLAFELDESMPSPKLNEVYIFYGEKTSRQIKVTCRGNPGHGSSIPTGTAGEKLHYVINKFMELRAQELKKLQQGAWIGDVLSINLTQVEGGVQINVIPENLSVSFDIRIPPQMDHDELHSTIEKWCKEAGENVSFQYVQRNPQVRNTVVDHTSAFWTIMEQTLKELGYETIHCKICPGATDARYVRLQNIPAINFTPFDNTPLKLHDHNETIRVDVYKKGIRTLETLVQRLANCSD